MRSALHPRTCSRPNSASGPSGGVTGDNPPCEAQVISRARPLDVRRWGQRHGHGSDVDRRACADSASYEQDGHPWSDTPPPGNNVPNQPWVWSCGAKMDAETPCRQFAQCLQRRRQCMNLRATSGDPCFASRPPGPWNNPRRGRLRAHFRRRCPWGSRYRGGWWCLASRPRTRFWPLA